MSEDYAPIRVHIASAAPGMAPGPAARHQLAHLLPRTVVLTADEPVKQLLRPDPHREYAIVIARTNDVVLTETRGDGQAPANTADATLASPNGGVIPHDVEISLPSITSELWAAAATYPTRVTVLSCVRREPAAHAGGPGPA